MKNKKIIFLVLVIILIVIAIIVFFIIKNSNNDKIDKGYELFGEEYCNGHKSDVDVGDFVYSTCEIRGNDSFSMICD